MKIYKSKFGYKTSLIISVPFILTLAFMIYNLEPFGAILSVSGIFILVCIFFLYINFATEYVLLENDTLHIKCGFLYHERLDIHSIKSIAKTRSIMSSPAPALDRIELKHGKYDLVIISPKNKLSFAAELTKINPEIKNYLTDFD